MNKCSHQTEGSYRIYFGNKSQYFFKNDGKYSDTKLERKREILVCEGEAITE